MENLLRVIENYFSKHLHCTNWSFNWFSQHPSLCTQHILIATSSCSSAQIVEEKTAALNQPLFGPAAGRRHAGLQRCVENWHKRKQQRFILPSRQEWTTGVIPQCTCISSRRIVCLKRIPFSFTNKQGKPHCRGRENGTNRSGGNVHHLN